jgi:hypothetical protein
MKPSFLPLPKPTTPTPPENSLKIQKITWEEMVEHQIKDLCYNCDEKYFPGKKCKEQNHFMAMTKDVYEQEVVFPPVEEIPPPVDLTPPFDSPEFELVISLNSLTGFSSPQTPKLIGYIKNKKFIILFYSGSTHNFIHRHISQ